MARLAEMVRALLEEEAASVPFHGWSHVDFVRNKAIEFARERGADVDIVGAAALVHDLNYIESPGSDPAAGRPLRATILRDCGYTDDEACWIEQVIDGAHTAWRGRQVDVETACLSDADTLYKALPITPVLYSHRFLDENKMDLADLAEKIVGEQAEKLEGKYYFYDDRVAARYRPWAEANLGLWQAVKDSMRDPDVQRLVQQERPA